MIALDGNACSRCGRGAGQNVVLQVHHKRYIPGRKPWEYPPQLCETVCSGCHAVEHGIIPPRSGWSLIGTDDLGDLSGECQYCGTALRHVYMVQHERWPIMEVGTDCCDALTGTAEASAHQAEEKKRRLRRRTFILSPRWKPGLNGVHNIELRNKTYRAKYIVQVVPDGNQFMIRIYRRSGKERYPSVVAAKGVVFDRLESGAVEKWVTQFLRKAGNPHGF